MTVTRAIFTGLALFLGAIYMALVWAAGVEGFQSNQGLLFWSGAVLVAMFVLGMLVAHRSAGSQEVKQLGRQTSQCMIVVVVPTPAKTPALSRNQKLLLGAVAAGAVGGLLASAILKARER